MKNIILALLCALPIAAQVPVTPITNPHATFVTAAGLPCAGCNFYTYVAGTTTPLATFVDSTGTSVNTNPIVLGADGGPATPSGSTGGIWLSNSAYKLVLKTPSGTTIWTADNVKGGGGLGGVCGGVGAIQIANSGVNGLTCDPSITINTTNHTLNVGTLPALHVTIGALSTATSWNFDTTSPATACASIGCGGVNAGTLNQLAYYAAAGNAVSGTSAIPAGITAITQSPGDNTTAPATTAYVKLPGAINPTSVQIAAGVAMTDNQGNGTKVQHSTGTTTTDHCAKFDSLGNTIDSGTGCNSGVVGVQTDQTASRALAGIYQNTNAFAIEVQGYITTTAGGADGQINCLNGATSTPANTVFSENPTATDAGGHAEFHIIVPAQWFYQCTATGTMTPTLTKWFEINLQ